MHGNAKPEDLAGPGARRGGDFDDVDRPMRAERRACNCRAHGLKRFEEGVREVRFVQDPQRVVGQQSGGDRAHALANTVAT